MEKNYPYLHEGHWESTQAGTKSVLSDDANGTGCISTVLIAILLIALVMFIVLSVQAL